MTRSQQLSYLKSVSASLSDHSGGSIERAAKTCIGKAILILENRIKLTRKDEFYESVYGLRHMKITKDTRHKIDLMIEYAGKETNKPSYRIATKEEIKRLTKFTSVKIDEIMSEELYLKRFHFIFG